MSDVYKYYEEEVPANLGERDPTPPPMTRKDVMNMNKKVRGYLICSMWKVPSSKIVFFFGLFSFTFSFHITVILFYKQELYSLNLFLAAGKMLFDVRLNLFFARVLSNCLVMIYFQLSLNCCELMSKVSFPTRLKPVRLEIRL